MVDHPLHEQRAGDREHLDRQGEGEQLSERAPQPDDAPQYRAQANTRRLLCGRQLTHRRQLECDAREMPRHRGHRQAAHPDRRVVNHDPVARDLGEHDEVVQIPMQDARRAQLAQFVQLQAQRARREPEPLGHADQVLQAGALQRDRQAPPQLGDLAGLAVVADDHRQACDAAFGSLGLHDHRQPRPPADREFIERIHPRSCPVTAYKGSSTHSNRRRRSSATSASSVIPGCSGTSAP